jgi:alpha-ribazole phosphatase
MARMSEILFIRHAETDMAGTFCGQSNPGLNARGRVQISELLRTTSMENIHEIYTSDLLRAQETAQAIAKFLSIECHLRPALREIHFGQWEGIGWKEIEQGYPAYAQRWVAEFPNLPAPGGECFGDFERRVLKEVELLMTRINGGDIAVVTHAGVLRTVLCRLHGYSEDEATRQTRSYCSIVRWSRPIPPSTRSIPVIS